MKCQVDAIQWGGVVAEIVCDLQKAGAIQWGGGSNIHFSVASETRRDFSGGGVVPFSVNGALLHFWAFQKGGARAPRAPPP